MENIDGALGFRATLNIDDFNVSSTAMERRIKQVSTTAMNESASMEDSILQFAQRGAAYITTYLVGQGMMGLLNSTVQVRGQFQQLEIAFETMLGSASKGTTLMNQFVETAAKTPFDLMGVASGGKQLLAYGLAADKVNDTLVKLGNIASGLSIPLSDIVYLYGTTMVQGRLYTQDVRQFTGRGIPLVKELAEMYGVGAEKISEMVTAGKVGFPDVEKVINKLTGTGGQFYNLMAKQSASLTGMISNLEDSWASMLNEIGKSNQDTFAGAINTASYLVEHYEDILRILKAVAIGYGSVKAAIVFNTLATKGYTGVALVDNTVRSAKIALLKADAAITDTAAAQTKAMTIAQEAHVATLQKELSAEELVNFQKKLRIATIAQMLTVQQQEYLSNLGLTVSSQGYEAAAIGVLSVEQQEALKKVDLTSKSAIYRAALAQEVAVKKQSQLATLEAMRTDVKAAYASLEAAKQKAIASTAYVEAAKYELWQAKANGSAIAVTNAEKKLEAATDQQAAMRKAALAAQTDFYTKKKSLEATATRQSTVASVSDSVAKNTQSVATGVLATVTRGATVAVKTLWAAMKTNPLGWILSIVGSLVSAITMFTGKSKESTDAQGEWSETTKKSIQELDTLIAVLSNTTTGSNTHKSAIEKLNALCKEYNVTLLNENSTLEQQKAKHTELTKAIQENTAERIKAKYAEQYQQEENTSNDEAKRDFKKSARKFKDYETTGNGEGYWYKVKEINNASEALFDLIEMDAKEASNKLKTLSGDAFNSAFQETVGSISKVFQQATGASDENMRSFQPKITKYLSAVVESAKKADEAMAKVNGQTNAYIKKQPEKTVVVNTNYAEMSFDDLEKKIKDTQKEISEINSKEVKVETDNSRLKELQTLLDKLLGAVNTKTENLNTEAGIGSRIKQLQDERSNVEINGAKYKELTAEIEKLQKKSPQKNDDKDQKENNNSLKQKELEATRKLEDARVEVMEEGYEKRRRVLELQHQRALEDIDKEEKELEAARKKAGKGELTKTEKEGFQERRISENDTYDKAQTQLFDGEIDYKKKQYQLYFAWVKNVGKEVADSHFEKLLKNGNSFTDWMNSKIQALEQKKKENPDSFTSGDASTLDQLKNEQNGLIGAKSAMDLFRESVQQALGQAQTLAEKLQAVADLKEKLAKGDFNLTDDEKTEAAYSLETQDSDLQKEVNETLLNDYRTYEEQKTSIQNEYALLRKEAQQMNDQQRVEQINKAESEALSALNAQMLMQTDSWKNLFTDLDSLTVEQIDNLITEIQEKMGTADLKLNPADMKAVLDKLDEARSKILDTNPFKAMGKAITAVFKQSRTGAKTSSAEIKRNWSNLAASTDACFDFVLDAIDSCDALGELIGENGKATISMIQGVATAGIAMAAAIATAEKGSVILAAISIALQAINWIATLFNNDKNIDEKIQSIQKNIDALERSFDRLQRAFDRTYWVYSDEEQKAHEDRIQAINDEIAALNQKRIAAFQAFDLMAIAETTEQIQKLNKELEKTKLSGDMFEIFDYQKKNLEEQQKKLQEQIDLEYSKKKTDNDKITEYENAIEDIDEQMEDMDRKMIETLAGTDVKSAIDEFADALVEAYCQGEDAAEALGAKTKEVLKNAVIEALKRNFLAKGINDAVNFLGTAMGKDGVLTDEEKAEFERLVNAAGELFNQALGGIGDWIKDAEASEEDPLKGAVTSMSEDTGGVIAGRLNAFIINQAEQSSILRQMLIYQAETAHNTGVSADALKEIDATLKRIENKENSLLSQGLS